MNGTTAKAAGSGGGGGGWQTVKSRADEKKKRQEEKQKQQQQQQKKDRLGVPVKSDVFALFDRVYREEGQQQQPRAPPKQTHGDYKGAYAHLEDEGRRGGAARDSDDSGSDDDGAAAPAASANGGAADPSALAAKAAKKPPKVKKPKVLFQAVAETVDIPLLQVKLVELQQRYANAPTSQLQMLSDTLLATFREVSLDLGKTLARSGLEQASEVPMHQVPPALSNALSSFVAAAPEAALAEVALALAGALLEGVPLEAASGGAQQPAGGGAGGKSKAGLLLMLALILRTRPQVVVLCVPGLRALGPRAWSSGLRLQHLLWTLNQAAASEPSAAAAAAVRLLLPALVGAPELPGGGSSSSGGRVGSGGRAGGADNTAPAAAAAAPVLLTGDDAQAALEYLRGLLRALGPAGAAAALRYEAGAREAVVPGGAVELVSRAVAGAPLAPQPPPGGAAAGPAPGGAKRGGGGGGGGGGKAASAPAGPAPQVLAGVAALEGPLRVLATAGAGAVGAGEWLPLALETAALSTAPPESPDALVISAARSVVCCLGAVDGAAALWESKHKALLKGSARVLVALQRQPALLAPVRQRKGGGEQLKALFAALPVRHRSHLANGRGWQLACAQAAEGACNALGRRRGAGGGRGGGGGGGGALLGVLGALGSVAALAGVAVAAAVHRREVGGLLAHYAGRDVAARVDGLLLAPLAQAVEAAAEGAAPHLSAAAAAAAPHWEALQAAARPHLAAAAEALGPRLQQARAALGPLAEQARAALGPLAEQAAALQQSALQQLEEIWQRAKAG